MFYFFYQSVSVNSVVRMNNGMINDFNLSAFGDLDWLLFSSDCLFRMDCV